MAKKVIKMSLNAASIDKAIQELRNYQKDLERKCREIALKCADLGAASARIDFSQASYVGGKDWDVGVEPIDKGYKIVANGATVLFLEFGAGAVWGYGHPQAGEFGMGPGTYPDGKGHWNDPNGWYLPKEKGGYHTWGNAPAMPMYNAARQIEKEVERIAREVFNG